MNYINQWNQIESTKEPEVDIKYINQVYPRINDATDLVPSYKSYTLLSDTDVENLFNHVYQELMQVKNEELKNKSLNFLMKLNNAVNEHWYIEAIKQSILYPSYNEDFEEFFLEWIYKEFRIGINISLIEEQNYWYLVSDKNVGSINARGSLVLDSVEKLLLWLFSFLEVYTVN